MSRSSSTRKAETPCYKMRHSQHCSCDAPSPSKMGSWPSRWSTARPPSWLWMKWPSRSKASTTFTWTAFKTPWLLDLEHEWLGLDSTIPQYLFHWLWPHVATLPHCCSNLGLGSPWILHTFLPCCHSNLGLGSPWILHTILLSSVITYTTLPTWIARRSVHESSKYKSSVGNLDDITCPRC